MIKICTASSARCQGCQIDRIEKGFIELGHIITPHAHEADLIYVNNPWFDQIIKDKRNGDVKGKIIFNVLDLAPHINTFPVDKLISQLSWADAVTSISKFVQNDLEYRTGYKSSIIYQPIKPVYVTCEKKYDFKFLSVGRLNDPNKRNYLAEELLSLLSIDERQLVNVGSEPVRYGYNWGMASDETLNELYNSVDFVLFFGRSEGIGLPMIEALAAGKIPIICNDLTTRQEFLPSEFFPEYDDCYPNAVSLANFLARFMQDNDFYEEFRARLLTHFTFNLSYDFSNAGVANKILKVYERI